jgi:WD40 repeat protein
MDIAIGPEHDGPQQRIIYNAFLSYSHSADARLAAALQRALHRFAKPVFRLRALRVFCDSASLGANPALWPALEDALHASEYLILMASPQSAASAWVGKEVAYWRQNKPAPHVLLVLTAGEIVWDNQRRDFDWTRTTALHCGFGRLFEAEPLWVDLRWAHNAADFPGHPRFRDCVAELAAPLHGRAKDDMVGEDVRQARRVLRLTRAVIALLSVLAVALALMSFEADRRRRIAARERDRALASQSHYLANAALRQIAEGDPEAGVLLAVEALPRREQRRPYVPEAEAALYAALRALGPRNTGEVPVSRPPSGAVSYSPDGNRLVAVCAEDTATVWDAVTGKQVAILKGHQKPVWYAAYVPDGSGIVTVSADGTARLWNAETGAQIRVFTGHQGPVLHAAISADGRLLATASADSTARVWQIDTGAQLATLRGHKQLVCCIQISPSGLRVATASEDGTVRLWDTQSGKTLAVFKDTPQALSSIAGHAVLIRFSPDGKLLATAHNDNAVRLWDAGNGRMVAVLKGAAAEVQDCAFSSDGRFFALASADGTARWWRLEMTDGEGLAPVSDPVIVHQQEDGPNTHDNAVVFGAEARFAATAGDFLQLWDPTNGSQLASLKLDAPADSIVASRDARRFAIIHLDHVTLWEVAGVDFVGWRLQQARESVPREDQGPVIETTATGPGLTWEDKIGWEPPVALTRDGRTAAVVTGREAVILDGQTGRTLSRIAGHSRVVSRALFNAAGDRLVTASYDGSAKIWDARTGANLMTLAGHQGRILDAALSPAGDLLATASEDGTVRLWSMKDGSGSVLRGHGAAVGRVAFSGDGKRVVSVSGDHTARVWDVAAKRELSTLRGDAKGGFGVAALNAAGDRVLTAGTAKDFTVRLWETATGRELHRWQDAQGTVLGLQFSPDGQTTMAWGADGVARLRRAQGAYDRVSNVGFGCAGPGSIAQAYLSDDGGRVVTVLHNGRTDFWDSGSGTSLLTLYTFPGAKDQPVCEVSLLPDGPDAGSATASPDLHTVLVAGDNGDVALFSLPGSEDAIRLARKLVPRALTAEERRRFFLAE